ncbi:MAG: sulfatase family protein [Limisphaerales bacterium]
MQSTVRFLLVLGMILGSLVSAKDRDRQKPNVVFILTDDQAPWALGLSGHPHADTPHLDKLFKQGMWLKKSYVVTPVCSPSRTSLMTSRYGSELGVTDWIHPRNEPDLGLNPKTITWTEAMQSAGYRTGLVGKWHLGVPDKFHPTKTGFDYFMGFRTGGNKVIRPTLEVNGKDQQVDGYTYDILTDDALRFIDRNKDRAFLLCLHYRAPHTAWLPQPDSDRKPFENLDPKIPNPDFPNLDVERVKRMTRDYLGSVKGIDRNVGRVLKHLDQLQLAENTIVVFTSDHGYSMGHNGIWHKGNGHWALKPAPPVTNPNIPRNQRPNMYDNSIFVPTAVRWPGKIAPNSTLDLPVANLDWYPTLLNLTGVPLPKGETIRGRDITPALMGKEIEWPDVCYGEYSTHHQSKTHMRMIRTSNWKLVRDFLNPERDELFDLKNDPAESRNVISQKKNAVVVRELHTQILTRMKAVKDPVMKKIKP